MEVVIFTVRINGLLKKEKKIREMSKVEGGKWRENRMNYGSATFKPIIIIEL